jgi:two-component system chemotaxis sensor kinase CheA
MNALLAQFIPEARDLLEQAGSGMLALEQDATSQTVINDVFRAVHTLKGSSGLFDVAPLTHLVHAAEDLLAEVRIGEIALTSDIVDRLLDSLDLVGHWIDALEAREALPTDAESHMTERVAVLRGWLVHRPAIVDDVAAGAAVTSSLVSAAPEWLAELPESDRLSAFMATSGARLLAWSFAPEENCFFRGDDPVAMLRHAPGLLTLRAHPREAFPSFETLDPLACLLRFEVLSDASRETIEEHMRYVADAIDVREIDARELAIPTGKPAAGPVSRDFACLARQHLAARDRVALDRSVAALLTMIAPESLQASALRWCKAQLERDGFESLANLERLIVAVETGILPPYADKTSEPKREPTAPVQDDSEETANHQKYVYRIAVEQIKVLETPTHPAVVQGRLESATAILKKLARTIDGGNTANAVDEAVAIFRASGDMQPLRLLVESWGAGAATVRKDDLAAPVAAAKVAPLVTQEAPSTEPLAESRAVQRVLRVDQSKIDAIMNLVAELIVAKNGLSYLASRVEKVHGSRAASREIKEQFTVIDRITQGLQVGVMSVRMMPVGQVFQRFPRLVRDIARKLGKKIELVIEGEDTEADKNVLESLSDPLIHMVRNSLDHGIETPDERRAAGKPEQGVVHITAHQENDNVVIEVRDDGKGIDLGAVKAKAVQRGSLTTEKAEQISDEEAANLVFAPGFSMKSEVSELSGRGVGMDVVRSAVIKAGGEVTLRTKFGVGTSVTVRLPLTMAVTRIVTIECRGRIFGIPMDLVVETVRLRRAQVHRIKSAETFVLRDAIIPLLRLADAMRLPQAEHEGQDGDEAVMVVRLGRDRIGLVVDGFRERMEVIVKPLEGVLEGMPGFSGTALLGDGGVLLIIDLQEMLRCQ